MSMKRLPYIVVLAYMLAACRQQPSGKLFSKVENSGISFTNTLRNTTDFNIFSYRNFYNGAGVAIGDVNNDGLADVFLTANMGPNRLYLNKGDWTFEDISEKAGFKAKQKWSTGVAMADVNADGLLDIYVCNAGYQKGVGQDNELWINRGDLTFEDRAAEFGLNDPGFTTHAAFLDYDLDGDLDCYILNNSFIPVNTLNYSNKRDLRAKDWPVAEFVKGGGDRLMRNDGGRFTDVSEQAGIYGSLIGFGLGVTVGDVNGDRWPDIYVSNDFFERDYLYINRKDGTFSEELESRIGHLSHSSMGADMADVDNDGHPDIFVTEMLPDDDYRLKTTTTFENFDVQRYKVSSGFYYQFMQNTLQLNDGSGRFSEIAHYAGVSASDWSWGALMFDADNDGFNDIYVSNGIYNDVTDQDFIDFFANDVIQKMVMTGRKEEIEEIIRKMPSVPLQNKLYRNLGNLKFTDMAARWGLEDKTFSNGAAYGDLDNDGDLDLIVSNVNQPAIVYRNNARQQNANRYLRVRLRSKGPNTEAVGSLVRVHADSLTLVREMLPTRGFQSSVDPVLHFGLGSSTRIDSVVVVWPDRTFTRIDNPRMDTLLTVDMQGERRAFASEKAAYAPMYAVAGNPFAPHREDDYVDFYTERNVPQMLSREGPAVAVADVNGDGLEDLYVSGTALQSGRMYLQTNGGFKPHEAFEEPLKDLEDVSALFFDADGDGDKDLMLGAGGNNKPSYDARMQNRLYLNDGKARFKRAALPSNMGNTSVLIPFDMEGDGDLDVFAASRSMPANYGVTPKSIVYVNDGKADFTLLAESEAGPLTEAGMVTGAVSTDVDGDRLKEIVVVGEWMAPRVFAYRQGRFTELKTSLSAHHGWWQSVASADIDGDGDEDLVLGNLGENFYLRPDDKHPAKLWINSFSRNMMPEKIVTRNIDGRDMPVFLKRDLTDQIPTLKKENLLHADYAKRSIQDLFDEALISSSTVKKAHVASSCVAWNEGGGRFTLARLPDPVQFSSVNAVCVLDADGDGRMDLVLAGNLLHWLPQFSRLDAGEGLLLLGRPSRGWEMVPSEKSGISVPGATRAVRRLDVSGVPHLLFARNDTTHVLMSQKRAR